VHRISRFVYINTRLIVFYLLYSAVILVTGTVLGNYVYIIPGIALVYYFLTSKTESFILFIVLWQYTSNYFIGQGFVNNATSLKLIDARYFILFVFLLNAKSIKINFKYEKKMIIWVVIEIMLIAIDNLTSNVLPSFGILIMPYYVYMYYLIKIPNNPTFTNKVFNLLIAICMLQLIVSVMQVNQIIAPPLSASSFAGEAIVSGLDDAAVGTMGSISSNRTSWLGTILFLFLFGYALQKKSLSITLFSFVFLLQYLTVDSKTLLFATIVALMYLIKRNLKGLTILDKRVVIYIILVIVSIGFLNLINTYYLNIGSEGISAPIEIVSNSLSDLSSDFSGWGKIQGFVFLLDSYKTTSIYTIFMGGNISVFDLDAQIRTSENSIMAQNNFTNSVSGWISIFAMGGLIGIFMVIWFFYFLHNGLREIQYRTVIGYSFYLSGKAMLAALILSMFIYYGITFGDLAFNFFLILLALVVRIELES